MWCKYIYQAHPKHKYEYYDYIFGLEYFNYKIEICISVISNYVYHTDYVNLESVHDFIYCK